MGVYRRKSGLPVQVQAFRYEAIAPTKSSDENRRAIDSYPKWFKFKLAFGGVKIAGREFYIAKDGTRAPMAGVAPCLLRDGDVVVLDPLGRLGCMSNEKFLAEFEPLEELI